MEEVPAAEGSATHPEFKKPVLVGRVGKLPRKVDTAELPPPAPPPPPPEQEKSTLPPAVLLKELSTPIPYKEPKWSGLPPEGTNYSLEVIKSGVILEQVQLMSKPYHVFGRLANCDVVMAHPTISRHHAVLQYKSSNEGDQPSGWYAYDCGSTHGTFLNRQRLKPQHYTRVHVGHIIKLGCSTRNFILLGPDSDAEVESELTITEMKQKHAEMKAEREREIREAAERRAKEKEEEERKREEAGVNWGMADDAEDEPDLADNPYASTTNEELYLDDPKKTLRGYYEREGLELQYDCQEKGVGQFVCRVELPIEDSRGQAVIAEVIHCGKKKEAVVACALEACRVLDRHGLLRQAKHESRRRKERDWSADDYYDSDEDTFLERTGAVERKRRLRMQRHGAADSEQSRRTLTYNDLVKQCKEQRSLLAAEERRLESMRAGASRQTEEPGDDDDLDRYMSSLASRGQSMAQKAEISKLKMEIAQLKGELSRSERMAEVARPTDLPRPSPAPAPAGAPGQGGLQVRVANSVVYGKRMRLKGDLKVKAKKDVIKKAEEEFVEEVDSDEEDRLKDEADEEKDKREGNSEDPSTSIEKRDNTMEVDVKEEGQRIEESHEEIKKNKIYGPMRPPENYVMPESYLAAESERDCQDMLEDE